MGNPRLVLSIGTVAAVAAVTGIVTSLPASASSGCTVSYRTTVQWPGGFGADVDIHNLGDPVDTWTLDWSFPAGQELTQAWNATATQNGARVTATDAGYNRSLDTGGNVSFGFLGTWTGSNPDPTSFRLNGVTCSGEVTTPDPTAPVTSPATGEPSATASPTTSTPTSTTTSTTPTTPVTSPATGGVPDDAAWVASGQWDSWTEGGYALNNDVWGSGAGTQTIWARTGRNWGVVADHPRTSGVKSYPHTGREMNTRLSALGSVTSSFDVSVPADGDYATAYDIWADNHAYEVMIWTNQQGAVSPIASAYDGNGPIPEESGVVLGGHTWNIYRGSNGSNAVFSFVRTGDTNSGDVDVLAVLTWLRTQGWWADVTIDDVEFGFELTGTAGRSDFVCNDFVLDYR